MNGNNKSPEALQQRPVDLRSHQIELELLTEELRQTQSELARSRARYFDFYDIAPVGYCTVNQSGLIRDANLATAALLGVTRDALPGQSINRFILPNDQHLFHRLRQRITQTLAPQHCELRMVQPDQKPLWVQLQAMLANDESGLQHLRIVLSNISERKQIEASLADSEQRYRTLVEWMPEPILVHRAGTILYVNPATVKMFGSGSASELVGHLMLERVHPAFREIVVKRMRDFAGCGLDSPMMVQKLLKIDGTVIDVEVQGTTISYDGGPALQVSMRDITQRTTIEAALRDSEQRFRTLVEWSPEGILVHRAGNIIYANPAAVRTVGASSAAELIGKPVIDRVHPDSRDVVLTRFRKFAELGAAAPMIEEKLIRLDGTTLIAEVQGTVIEYDGEPALHASVRDISERKSIEAELEAARLKAEHSNRAKSRFLASASHDLRQPAHALGMFIARLAELPNDAQTRHLVGCMDASVRALQDMLDGFFDLSQLDAEQTQISTVAFPIENLLGQLRNEFSGSVSEKGLRLRVLPSKAWVQSEPNMLHRILLNLVSNAIRYTPQGSVLVACRLAGEGTQLRVEVRDSGIGIPAQHHQDIFQEFFQIENPQRDRNKGLGVGLSIVERSCRLLNHSLALRSSPGRGSCFSVTLPLASAHPANARENSGELSARDGLDGLNVLLIEDDELGRVGLAGLLTSWGCRVLIAEGTAAACELYRHESACDIIISDYRLGGGINGIEAVQRLKTVTGRATAACLISGDTDASWRKPRG